MEYHVAELLPEYALGLLDDEEKARVEQHLKTCVLCQREAEQYQQTTNFLPLAVSSVEPPPALKQKVLRRLSPEALPQRQGWRERLGDLFMRPALGWAVAALFALAFGLSSLLLWQQSAGMQAARATQPADSAPRVVAMRGTENAPQATGYIMVFQGDQYGSLVVRNLPPPSAGQAYQLWLIQDGKRTSGGVFTVNEEGYGVLRVEADRPLTEFQSFGITIEPQGGSPGPTGKKVLGSGG